MFATCRICTRLRLAWQPWLPEWSTNTPQRRDRWTIHLGLMRDVLIPKYIAVLQWICPKSCLCFICSLNIRPTLNSFRITTPVVNKYYYIYILDFAVLIWIGFVLLVQFSLNLLNQVYHRSQTQVGLFLVTVFSTGRIWHGIKFLLHYVKLHRSLILKLN